MTEVALSLVPERRPAHLPELLSHIGGTPLLRLARIGIGLPSGTEIHGKAEYLNPSGSLKDRPAKAMILAGLASGALTPQKAILDATSGNTGIAYAMIGAAMGYGVTLCLPANATAERKRILRSYGAPSAEPRSSSWPIRAGISMWISTTTRTTGRRTTRPRALRSGSRPVGG